MNTRKQIILAVANGCKNTRQISTWLNRPLGTINSYFWDNGSSLSLFVNGKLLQWSPSKTNTLQLAPRVAIIRGADGRIKDVGMIADMDDLEESYNKQL